MSIPNPIVLLDARARYVHPAFRMTRASTKTVFDSTGRLVTVPANALGWDHDPATGQARGYLVEPSATNLLLRSNDLTQGAWSTFGSSITGNAITGPDGNGMAKLVENNANQAHTVGQAFTIGDGDTIAAHLIVKAGEREGVRLEFRQNGDGANNFTMRAYLTGDGSHDAPTAGGTATAIDGGITHLDRGFYHIWIVGTLGAGITDARLVVALLDGSGSIGYQGDGTSGLYVGYCQAEVGSYPTSYIETGASTATRSVDQLVLADPADYPWWSHDAGTLIIDYVNWQKLGNSVYWHLGNLFLMESLAGDLRVSGTALESDRGVISAQNYLPRRRYVVALSWDGEVMRASANGEAVVSRSMTANPTGDLQLGWHSGGWSSSPRAHFARAVYYPSPIPNADLQSLTAIQE